MASRLGYTMSVLLEPLIPTLSRSEPSTSNVLYSTRPPLTLYFVLPTTPTFASSWPVWLLTPGASAINCVKLRPFSPVSTTSFCVMVPESWAVSVSTPAAFCPCTSTEVLASAGSSVMSTRAISPTATCTPDFSNLLNPCAEMETVYEPRGNSSTEYAPRSLVTAVWGVPDAPNTVTVTPGKTAPLLSVTVPPIPAEADRDCAKAASAKAVTITRNETYGAVFKIFVPTFSGTYGTGAGRSWSLIQSKNFSLAALYCATASGNGMIFACSGAAETMRSLAI